MQMPQVYENCRFEGTLADICEAYVAEKRALGFVFNAEARKLSEFSRISTSLEIPPKTLTKEAVQFWILRRPNDSDKNIYHRFLVIKGFAKYMQRMGYSAYMPLNGDIPKLQVGTYVPHIFTPEEIVAFFNSLDSIGKTKSAYAVRWHQMMKQIFRLLYCCGLRISEVLSLSVKDIDWDERLLIIHKAKGDKPRYIPMSDEMANNLKNYVSNNIHEPFLFPDRYGGQLGERSAYTMFRSVLEDAGISHMGRGIGPRVHDFRHTFSVHCLQKWIRNGVPLSSALPRLSTYLGHCGMQSTEKYLRMTAEVYPEIADMLSKTYGHLIPEEILQDESN